MAEIRVLDKHTAELIAAGEVVERPASAIKELCENAIDASAKNISVYIERGGISLMQIQDDGCGIEPEFVATAFLRHATSKVKTQNDLEAIHTLGFRGEALASIASVSKVELLTKTADGEYASLYKINAGEEEGLCAAARPVGTTITVRDLFYNTPARMKFLKKDSSEATFVSEVVSQLALSHPEVSFKHVRDGKIIFHTPGDDSCLSAAYELFGKDFASSLTKASHAEGKYSLKGYISKPSLCRQSRSMQFFFINGRFVKNRTMMAALEAAYRGTLMQGKFPGCILFLNLPPHLVDVNVHPAKTEVRFARENEVFDIIYTAVKQALMQENKVLISPHGSSANDNCSQSSDKKTFAVSPLPPHDSTMLNKAINNYFDNLLHTKASSDASLNSRSNILYTENEDSPVLNLFSESKTEQTGAIDITDENPIELIERKIDLQPEQTALYKEAVEDSAIYIGEVFKTYIIVEYGAQMCLIDKHAAHERLLYEKLSSEAAGGQSQMLLEPVAVTLGADEKNALIENSGLLNSTGIELEDFGGFSVLVRSVPCDIEVIDIQAFIQELAQRMVLNRKDTKTEKFSWVYHSIACRAAIKGGDKTHSSELLILAQKILRGEVPPFCPHGRPVIIKFTQKELEKHFGRQT